RLALDLANRFSHRAFAGLDVRITGGAASGAGVLTAGPGETGHIVIDRDPGSELVRVEVWHPEGWLVDGFEWPWPGARAPRAQAVLDHAEPLELDLSEPGSLSISSHGRRWLRGWPDLQVLDVDQPH